MHRSTRVTAARISAAFIAVAWLGLSLDAAANAPAPNTTAPDFTLRALDGHNLRLAELRGQVVLVNFWATWCGPCREEMPRLDALYQKYHASGFTLLGVNIDDDPRNAAGTAQKLKVSFPVLLDTDKTVSRLYDLGTMPSTVLIDRDGRVRFLHRGYREGTEAEYDQQIRELLR
ncbi:MAG TPA: TlpA disulfide reductase family protein [Burkholderiaceae bacterium]|nr:TlpA disulfide reductase family protein [Burkholderiaceae bacterium]